MLSKSCPKLSGSASAERGNRKEVAEVPIASRPIYSDAVTFGASVLEVAALAGFAATFPMVVGIGPGKGCSMSEMLRTWRDHMCLRSSEASLNL